MSIIAILVVVAVVVALFVLCGAAVAILAVSSGKPRE